MQLGERSKRNSNPDLLPGCKASTLLALPTAPLHGGPWFPVLTLYDPLSSDKHRFISIGLASAPWRSQGELGLPEVFTHRLPQLESHLPTHPAPQSLKLWNDHASYLPGGTERFRKHDRMWNRELSELQGRRGEENGRSLSQFRNKEGQMTVEIWVLGRRGPWSRGQRTRRVLHFSFN